MGGGDPDAPCWDPLALLLRIDARSVLTPFPAKRRCGCRKCHVFLQWVFAALGAPCRMMLTLMKQPAATPTVPDLGSCSRFAEAQVDDRHQNSYTVQPTTLPHSQWHVRVRK
jgi:hypothetical protein